MTATGVGCALRLYAVMRQPLFCMGLEMLVRRHYSPEVLIAEVPNVDDLARVVSDRPAYGVDLLVTDLAPGDDRAGERVTALRKSRPGLRWIVFLPLFADDSLVCAALKLGADGYLLQSASGETVLRAIDVVARGQGYLEPRLAAKVLAALRAPRRPVPASPIPLTRRERTMLQLTADGWTTAQVAEALGLREKTVRNLWSALCAKLGVRDRTQAVLWAVRTGQVTLHPASGRGPRGMQPHV